MSAAELETPPRTVPSRAAKRKLRGWFTPPARVQRESAAGQASRCLSSKCRTANSMRAIPGRLLDLPPHERRHVEVLAVDNRRLALFKAAPVHRLECHLLLALLTPTLRRRGGSSSRRG